MEYDGYYAGWPAYDRKCQREKVTDYKEGEPTPERKFDFEPFRGRRPNEGYIGLQNHGDEDVVYFKEVAVKPLQTNKIIFRMKTKK